MQIVQQTLYEEITADGCFSTKFGPDDLVAVRFGVTVGLPRWLVEAGLPGVLTVHEFLFGQKSLLAPPIDPVALAKESLEVQEVVGFSGLGVLKMRTHLFEAGFNPAPKIYISLNIPGGGSQCYVRVDTRGVGFNDPAPVPA